MDKKNNCLAPAEADSKATELNTLDYTTILERMKPHSHVYTTLRHLLDYGSISSYEAFREYGNTRLSATIFILKKNYLIPIDIMMESSKNRYGEPVTYGRYFLKEDC